MASSSLGSRIKKLSVEDLIDYEEDDHMSNCTREPSKCHCPEVNWISASIPYYPESINSGKWMLFPNNKNVDCTWKKVKELIVSNKLGDTAKVSTHAFFEREGCHLICIYTNDHENVSDVFRVLISIRQNFQAERAISYKTDEATRSGVYTVASGRAKEGIWDDKHPNFKVCKYTSPAVADRSGKDWVTGVKMYQNNIGVECHKGLVAEARAPQPVSAAGIEGNWRIRNNEEKNTNPTCQTPLKGYDVFIHDPPKIIAALPKTSGKIPIVEPVKEDVTKEVNQRKNSTH